MTLHVMDVGQGLPPLSDVVGNFNHSTNVFTKTSGATITGLKKDMVITITNAVDAANNTNYTLAADATTTLSLGSIAASENGDTITITPITGHNAPTNPTVAEVVVGSAVTNHLNCFEIYKTRGAAPASITNGLSQSTYSLNRLYPATQTTLDHQTTLSTTPGYRIHSDVTLSDIVTGSALKTDNDYFVLVYSDNGNKHHFAKITEVTKYDTVGDGFDFEPRLKEDIPKGTKFAVFKGPSTTNTDVVAVGYGLTGTGDKHNHYVNVSRPTFYFYNDRIDNPLNDELAHNTKYEIRKSRYVSSASTVNSNTCFLTTQSFGPRLLDKSIYKQTVKIVDNAHTFDSTASATTTTHYTNYAGSGQTYTADFTTWDDCFRNSSRAVYAATVPGAVSSTTRSGPSTHLRFVESPEITKILENIESVNVSKTATVSGNYTELKILDFEKILDEKVKMHDDLKVRSVIYQQKFTNAYNVNLPGKVSTNATTGQLEFSELDDEHDLSRLIDDGETIRIGKYIYVVATVASKSSGTQVVTIDAYKTETATTFTVSSTIPETISDAKAFRRAWSGKKSNLMTNAKIDTEIDGSGNITKNGIALTTSQVDYKDLDVVVRDGDLSALRFSVNKADKNNQYFELNSTSTNIYQYGTENRGNNVVTTDSTKYIAPIIHYVSGAAYIDNTIFNGTVEYINSETSNRIMRYTITGRDDLGKLLAKVNNKKYLYSDDYIYSTQPPYANFTYTGFTIDNSTSAAGTVTVTVDEVSGSGAIYKGDLLFYKDVATATGDNPSNYIFLGIASTDKTTDGSLVFTHETFNNVNVSTTKNSTDSNYNKYVTTDLISSDAKLYAIRHQISLGKNLSTDITKTAHQTTLKGSSDKGVNFISGRKIDPITGADDSALPESKSSGFTVQDGLNSLGYAISNISEIETGKLSPETTTIFNAAETSSEILTTPSSMAEYAVIDMETIDNSTNKITVAPLLPVVLGRIDSNTSSTKGISNTHGIYLINDTGLPNGGYLHLLNSETDAGMPITFMGKLLDDDKTSAQLDAKNYADYVNRFGTFIWRYIDLQEGNIYYEDEIANRILGTSKTEIFGKKGQQIYKDDKGRFRFYAVGVRLNNTAFGFDTDTANSYLQEGSPETRGPTPALGSNFYDTTILPVELSAERNENSTTRAYVKNLGIMIPNEATSNGYFPFDVDKYQYEANDPKVVNLFLFALGDVLPDSKSRPTHIGGVSNRSFSDYSIILKRKKTAKVAGDSHQKYKGILESRELLDSDYDSHPITEASISPDEINRFGLIRLVELTMDWHFNPVDIENIQKNNEYTKPLETVGNRHYQHSLIKNSNDQDVFFGNNLSPGGLSGTTTTNTTGTTDTIAFNNNGMFTLPRDYYSQDLIHLSGGTANSLKFVKARTRTQSCTTVSGDATVTTADTRWIHAGMAVSGTNIPGGATVSSITNATTFELSANATGNGSVTVTFSWDYAYSDFTTASSPSSGTDASPDMGIVLEDVTQGKYGIIDNVKIDSTHVELKVKDAGQGRDIDTYVVGNTYRMRSIGIWQTKYGTPVKLGTASKFAKSSGTAGTLTLTGSSAADVVSGNLYFEWNNTEHYMNNTITDFNRHLITGHMMNPYFFSDRNKMATWSNEILPNSIALPLTASVSGDSNDESIGTGRKIFRNTRYALHINTSRVINDLIDNNFKILNANTGSVANSTSYYLGVATADRHTDYNAFSSGSKTRENLIGLITDVHNSFSFDDEAQNMIDALSGVEIPEHGSHILHNNGSGANQTGSSVFDLDSERDMSMLDGGEIFTGKTSSVSTTFQISNLGKAKVPFTGSFFDKIKIIEPDDLDYSTPLTVADNTEFLIGRERPDRLVSKGMTVPIAGMTHPRGNLSCQWLMSQYGPYHEPTSHSNGIGSMRLNTRELRMEDTNCNQDETGAINSYLFNNSNYQTGNRTKSQMSGAEIFYKPVLDTDSADVSVGEIFAGADGKKRTRIHIVVMNDFGVTYTQDMVGKNTSANNKFNRWIHFAPDLTGYYLVNEYTRNTITGNLVSNRAITNTTPISGVGHHKIISHRINRGLTTYTDSGNTIEEIEHILEIDNVSGTIGNNYSIAAAASRFRVMRVAQDTFYDFTPTEIPLLTFTNQHSKIPYENACFTTIDRFNHFDPQFDGTSNTFYNEGLLSMFMPIHIDGLGAYVDIRQASDMFHTSTSGDKLVTGTTYNMHITDGKNKMTTSVIVSGRTTPTTFSLQLGEMKKMHGCVSFGETFTVDIFNKPGFNTERCSIGTALNVVDEAEQVINDLIENTDITYTSTSDSAKYYQAFNIQGVDTFTASNFVASLKDRKLIVDGKTIQLVKTIENLDYTNIEFNEFSKDNRIAEISRDSNLFDFYNQVTVYGDGVKSTYRDVQSIKKDGLKELEEVDLTIITKEACNRRALKLLRLHSELSSAIEFKVLYEQCPYLRPGHIVTIDYPSEKISRGEYIVLEIDYSIGGFMEVKVGKYAKGLTNRIAELIIQNKKTNAALRGSRYQSPVASSFMHSDLSLRAVKLKVEYTTASSTVANTFGFTPVFGFDTTLGIMVPTGESTRTLEYDLL
jgi:hypothetical protein